MQLHCCEKLFGMVPTIVLRDRNFNPNIEMLGSPQLCTCPGTSTSHNKTEERNVADPPGSIRTSNIQDQIRILK